MNLPPVITYDSKEDGAIILYLQHKEPRIGIDGKREWLYRTHTSLEHTFSAWSVLVDYENACLLAKNMVGMSIMGKRLIPKSDEIEF
jgi:hypothetical protein